MPSYAYGLCERIYARQNYKNHNFITGTRSNSASFFEKQFSLNLPGRPTIGKQFLKFSGPNDKTRTERLSPLGPPFVH